MQPGLGVGVAPHAPGPHPVPPAGENEECHGEVARQADGRGQGIPGGEPHGIRPRIRDHQPLGVPRDPLRGRPLALLRQEAGRCQVDKAGSNHAGDTEQSSGDQDV